MYSQIQHGLFKLDFDDHYAILGVALDADAKEVRQRYLKIAYRLHPDTCQAESEEEKQKASKILSKLVNPAYEHLSKDKSRKECELLLSEMGRVILEQRDNITIAGDIAKTLARTNNEKELEQKYHESVESLAAEQYKSLDKITAKIAQISELNLVYLMLRETAKASGKSIPKKKPVAMAKERKPDDKKTTTPPVEPQIPTPPVEKQEEKRRSPAETYLKRGQDCLEKQNWGQAVVDLRSALKLDPNNAVCHALLGSAYLNQNQMGMAKVHINKAAQLNAQDATVKKVQAELAQKTGTPPKAKGGNTGKKSSQEQEKGKKQKKEAPTIFGIRLW